MSPFITHSCASSTAASCGRFLLFVSLLLTTTTTTAFILPSTLTSHSHISSLQMFTGIVEEMGEVLKLEEQTDVELWDGTKGKGTQLTVKAKVVLEGAYLGCSICVSGVCLTATQLGNNYFVVGLAPETLCKSNLGTLTKGSLVNLERASPINGRNSGHFVQGHVDDTGLITEKWTDGDSLVFKIQTTPDLIKYIVPKGFIAVDGTSLTVVDVYPQTQEFTFMLVEYTQSKIIIPFKNQGDLVNLEVDVLAKYSESALAAMLPRVQALEEKVALLEQELEAVVTSASRETTS